MTQTALATMVGRSSGTVSKWEKGDQVPEADALERLSERLAMPSSWFLTRPPVYGDRVCFYRSTASVTKEAQTIAHIRLKWLNEISVILQGWIDWPSVNIPRLGKNDHLKISDSDIEQAAQACRIEWKLGLGPISDVTLVLENAGAICVREELGFTRMDGASQWFDTDGRPYVFLAADKANGVRSRFDAAHELGHLVLHRDIDGLEFSKRYPELERQAHLFAGAFLMPAESFAAELVRPSLDTFITLKSRWKVSVGAMIMRCKQLNIIDDDYATRLWKNYSARGWRKSEPLDDRIDFEPVRLLPRAINLLLSDGGLTKEGLLASIGLGASDCERLCGLPEGFFSQQSTVSSLESVRFKKDNANASGTAITGGGRVLSFPPKNKQRA
ncbi:XRE family transcriptional regulator [Paraburkholderia bonniea]|uniref:helix-turn-helix domain-containing protein n=1 Tax=Paraburkholderia bonniea TaxID=2152891 RepID=UPI002572762F|nr:XRE family transcriptional regulator [Paraburkholderia bonniea]WJF89741.1 XRE family transcriptional regulator [Paraburkholderia bonniea]WJF93055.1 XRE family transcriptional regulator [Paraburkholderia bonniea]